MNNKKESETLNKKWELVNFCEFDKYATKSYCAIHNVDESKNLGDITKVDENELDDFNMMTWGFPCTDISVAGKQKGFIDEDGEKTRSGMYYEGIRILRKKKPALSIIENVKNLTGKRFKNEFEMVLSDLDDAGYNSYYKVLNAKNYGVPQNRERVFIISIRKDLDNGNFKFPEPFDNGLRLKDLLEDEVDERFYVSDDKVERFITNLNDKNSLLYNPCQVKREGKSREYSDYAPTLTSRDYKDPRLVNENAVKQVGNIVNTGNWDNPQRGRIYSSEGCSPALNCCGGGGLEPKIITGIDKSYNNTKFIDAANCITSREDRGVSNRRSEGTANKLTHAEWKQKMYEKFIEDANDEVSGVITNQSQSFGYRPPMKGFSKTLRANANDMGIVDGIRIRKLTPKECFRLMGFSDEDFDAAQKAGISNSQLYKQAGNSIVVDVLYYIYRELYIAMPYLFNDLKLSSFFSGIGAFEIALDRLYKDINSGNFTKPQMD